MKRVLLLLMIGEILASCAGNGTDDIGSCSTFWAHADQGSPELIVCEEYAVLWYQFNDEISSYEIELGMECIVTEHANFGGKVDPLTGSGNLSGEWNDTISSIKCAPEGYFSSTTDPLIARVFEHDYFAGAQRDIPVGEAGWLYFSELEEWNDRISSIKVGPNLKCDFYEDSNYGGIKYSIGPNQYDVRLSSSGWNDKISSVECREFVPTPSP